MNKFEELEKLQYLRKNNAITEQEFENEKQKILNNTSAERVATTNKKVKSKMQPWKIILIIVAIIVARIYNNWYN